MPGTYNALTQHRTAPAPNMLTGRQPSPEAEQPIGQVTGQDAGGGLWVKTQDGQEIALPADRINVRNGMAYAMPPQEVGIGGKALGALGLDLDGDRGRTSWGNALTNSTKARGGRGNVLPVDEDGLAVPGMIAQPIEDFNAMSPQNSVEENSKLSFSASGLAPTVGLGASAAGAVPAGAVAANGVRFGKGRLQLETPSPLQAADEGGWRHQQFQIIRDGEPIGKATSLIDPANKATIDTMSANAGSNSLGFRGIRDLREAFREYAPEVTTFSGDRSYGMKTGEAGRARQELGGSGRKQDVDLYSNSGTGASVPLAMQALERRVVPTGRGSLMEAHMDLLDQTGQDIPFSEFQAMAKEAGLTHSKDQYQLSGELLGPETEWMHGTALPKDADLIVPDGYYGTHMTRSPDVAGIYGERGAVRGYDQGFSNPFTLPPRGSPGYDSALARAQEYLPGFDGTKASLENNAATYSKILRDRGYDSIVSKDETLLDDAFEGIAFNPNGMNRLYSNNGTGASVPLRQRLLGQRGGQAAATDTAALQAEMSQLQQRHAQLFGKPYTTPQPPGGATPETMAADLAELRGRIQGKERQLTAQPQTGGSVPAAGPPPAPSIPPAVQRQIDMKAEERPQLRQQSDANPYANIRDPVTKRFLPKAERDRLISEYNRRGDVNPIRKDTPWGAEPLDPMAYKTIAETQQQFERAKRGITQANMDIAKNQQAMRSGKGDTKALRKENEELRKRADYYEAMYNKFKPKGDE